VVAAACLSIAVNGSRGLPQYFLQAGPALALAFGVAAAWARPRLGRPWQLLAIALVASASSASSTSTSSSTTCAGT
jgi:hypothetical protein